MREGGDSAQIVVAMLACDFTISLEKHITVNSASAVSLERTTVA